MPSLLIRSGAALDLEGEEASLAPLVAKLRNYMKWSLSGSETPFALWVPTMFCFRSISWMLPCASRNTLLVTISITLTAIGKAHAVVRTIDIGSVSLNCSGAAGCGGNL